jgi:hypothetical protein
MAKQTLGKLPADAFGTLESAKIASGVSVAELFGKKR